DRATTGVLVESRGPVTLPALLTQLPLLPGDERLDPSHFPPGWLDGNGQQVDLRPNNSWALELGEVPPLELLEVHAVNCLAPFLLLRRLEGLLFHETGRGRYVVNVSAMEGQLNATYKTGRHPHTNMAKAALNMLTRTCAGPYAERGVYMNSVDTGWVTNEAPHPTAERMAAEGFREPLDVIDGAARVLDPIFSGLTTGRNEHGKFWKDYRPIEW
ncbi:MAG: SDR family oxidoreductase, partial [Gemmataceae bacterium]|nr:SDR family oxidoreductase [Gemmataceae bacterium]